MTEANRKKLDERIEIVLDQISKQEDEARKEKLINELVKLVELDLKDYDVCSKCYKDEELVKNEKRKVLIDNGTKFLVSIVSFLATNKITKMVLKADLDGSYISKLALSMISKFKN